MSCSKIVDDLNAQARARGWTFVCSPSVEFDAASLNAVSALWQELAISGRLPAWTDFSVRALEDLLPDLLVADVVQADKGMRFRYRLMGARTAHYLGEMTGLFMDEYLPPAVHERTVACYRAIVETCCPLRFVTQFSLDKISFLSGEFFGAPLARDGFTPDTVMTVTDFRVRK